jgi:uncharacterized protein (DUF2062 family)
MGGGFFHRRIVDPIVALLRQGITPEKISLGLACGVAIGIFPVIGSTTILCALAAILLRLNLPAVQLVNYLVYPLQIALLIPFFHFGDWLFGVEPLPLNAGELVALFKADFLGAIRQLWDTTLHAMVAWLLVGPPAATAMYAVFTPLVKKLKFRPLSPRL